MFKIALDAGHGLYTSGKRVLKSLDEKETREWVLNSRICDKVEKELKAYKDCVIYRVDDVCGTNDVALKERVDKANSFGCDLYLSVHHDAGINGGTGGGMSAFVHTNSSVASTEYQKIIYEEFIKATGLKGNRTNPISKKDLYVLRKTNMPAVLIECGFMDSATDAPVILTEDFANKAAAGIKEALVKIGKLEKKQGESSMMTLDEAKKTLKEKVGLEDKTIEFMLNYKFGTELVTKLALAVASGGK